MGKILTEDATNIHFPISCDVLVDDVEHRTAIKTKGGDYSIGYSIGQHDKIISMAMLAKCKMGFIPCIENLELLLCVASICGSD